MRTRDLTNGSIIGNLLIFAFPMMLGNILQQIYNIVDTIIVGKYIGAQALAAVGSAYSLMTFLTSLIIGLCMGSGALFSADFGAGKEEQLRKDIWISFIFIGSTTAVILLLIYPLTDKILLLLQIPDEILNLMKEYTQIVFAGIGFLFFFNFFAFILRSVGNSSLPLFFLIASSLLNILLDLILVIQFNAGVNGAAIATVISQAIAGIGITGYTLYHFPQLHPCKEVFDWKRWKDIILNDIFTGIQQSVMNFGILMIQGLVNSFGTVIMAAFAAAVKIDTIAYAPSQEFANAYSLFISQNYGANEQDRIRRGTKAAFIVSATFCLCISVLMWYAARYLMGFFVENTEVQIIEEGVRYLHIEGATYIGIGCLFLFYGYFRGIQKGIISLVLTIISLGTRVALSYLLAPRTPLGVVAIWISIPIGWGLADATGYFLMNKSKSS